MKLTNGRLMIASGALLMVLSLLVLSMAAPTTTLGQETDVPADPPASIPGDDTGTDTGEGGVSPSTLPDSGTGYRGGMESAELLLVGMLAALGLMLAGGGVAAIRQRHRVEGS